MWNLIDLPTKTEAPVWFFFLVFHRQCEISLWGCWVLHKSHERSTSYFWEMLGVLKGMFDSTTCLIGASLMSYSESCKTLNKL